MCIARVKMINDPIYIDMDSAFAKRVLNTEEASLFHYLSSCYPIVLIFTEDDSAISLYDNGYKRMMKWAKEYLNCTPSILRFTDYWRWGDKGYYTSCGKSTVIDKLEGDLIVLESDNFPNGEYIKDYLLKNRVKTPIICDKESISIDLKKQIIGDIFLDDSILQAMENEFINCWDENKIGSFYYWLILDYGNLIISRINSVMLKELEAKRDKSRDMVDYPH